MSHLFRFLGCQDIDGNWCVTGEQLFHLRKVLRLQVGNMVEIADGNGNVVAGALQAVKADCAIIQVEKIYDCPPRLPELTICVGALRGATLESLLPSLVELGMDKLILFGQQGVAKFRYGDKACVRLQRIMVSAFKQCKRAYLPSLEILENCFLIPSLFTGPQTKVVLAPSAAGSMRDADFARDTVIVAGSEKGLLTEELMYFRNQGFFEARFCDTILTSKTAVIGAASFVAAIRS